MLGTGWAGPRSWAFWHRPPHGLWARALRRSTARPGSLAWKIGIVDSPGIFCAFVCDDNTRAYSDGVPCYYKAFTHQERFHHAGAKYRLFGAAAGPGKTKALLWEAIRQAFSPPRSDSLLLRRTYPELEPSLLAYFRRAGPRALYKNYNESKHLVTWTNGSTTRFGYCRNENDVYQYQGAEFLFIGIDELTHFTLKQWQFLTSRNRCPIPNSFSNMAGATNPGNVGHAWVKALWVDKQAPSGFQRSDLYDPRH